MRAFIGIPLTGVGEILQVMDHLKPDGRLRLEKPDDLHITVMFFPDLNNDQVEEACTAIRNLHMKDFSITYSRISGFPDERSARVVVVMIDSPELVEIHEIIGRSLHTEAEKKFKPHLTLARAKSRISVPGLGIDQAIAEGKRETVSRIVIYESILGPAGAVHRPICANQFM